ncbi:MAG: hypothetical protein AB1644_13495 [Candidatus Zixiibacteriota bacterium]
MTAMRTSRHLGLYLVIGIGLIAGCTGSDPTEGDPRQVVISFFGAMEKNDQATLAHLLDLASLMKNIDQDYAFQTDSPRVFRNPKDVLDDLTDNGLTKRRWFSYQRIVNEAQVSPDAATVEVTFVDKEASKGYRTFFGLHKVNDKWKIYSFKTVEEPRQ